jgi:hypothetical protein
MTQLRIINPIKITQILITYFPPKLKFKYTCKTSVKLILEKKIDILAEELARQHNRKKGRGGD